MQIDTIRNKKINNMEMPEGRLAGYAALISSMDVRSPLPKSPSVISDTNIRRPKGTGHVEKGGFELYPNTIAIKDNFDGHMTFALKNEKLDLLMLKRIFDKTPDHVMVDYVKSGLTSQYKRQAWFFYEWLTGKKLDIPDMQMGNYIDAIDGEIWQTSEPTKLKRYRINDNLPGTRDFCPLVKKDLELDKMSPAEIHARVSKIVHAMDPGMEMRIARRLLLKDSRSTFLIESEEPSNQQLMRWGEAVIDARTRDLDLKLLLDLQKTLMKDKRFIATGMRREGVFLGDRVGTMPIPTWIGARPQDIPSLMNGLLETEKKMKNSNLDPISQAAAIAFGFVYMHPFEDGNGRIHRYIIQHILSNRNMTPMDINLSVSKSIWHNIDGYHDALRSLDIERLPFIKWAPTSKGNVEVLEDTSDLYRYFDATNQAKFLAKCVDHVISHDIPNEIEEIYKRDKTNNEIKEIVEMPTQKIDKIVQFILQNKGTLSKAKRKSEFPMLEEDEVKSIESIVREVYEIEEPSQNPTR